MNVLLAVAGVGFAGGLALLLGELRWFRRRPMRDRLLPYLSPAHGAPQPVGGGLRVLLGPPAQRFGGSLASALGVREDLALRLERIRSGLGASEFRLRQLAWAGASFAVGLGVLGAVRPPPFVSIAVLMGAPLLAFLLLEQQLSSASARRQRCLFLELPVVTEQLGMLLGSGFSVGGSLQRLAARGHGVCAEDLALVCARMQQGMTEMEALHEWATVMRVDALDRLVAVLALNREAGDLGALIAEEARSVRREAHRELLETIERRSQQVWIPVTVATLVPGVLFLAVPFIDALRLFGAA